MDSSFYMLILYRKAYIKLKIRYCILIIYNNNFLIFSDVRTFIYPSVKSLKVFTRRFNTIQLIASLNSDLPVSENWMSL